jgi:hypothetical protein
MSTKTTFKRIALVTVAALGFGGLSVVTAPMASAASTSSISLNTSSLTVVGGNGTSDTPSALIRVNTTSDTIATQGLQGNEKVIVSIVGVPTSVTAKTLAANGAAITDTATFASRASDLIVVEYAGASQTSGTTGATPTTAYTNWSKKTVDGTLSSGLTDTTTSVVDGTLTASNTFATNMDGSKVAAASLKIASYYVGLMPRAGASVIDQGVYTVRFTYQDTDGNNLSYTDLKIDFVSTKNTAGALLSLGTGGSFVAGTALGTTGATGTAYVNMTLKNRDNGRIVSHIGWQETPTVKVFDSEAVETMTGTIFISDSGSAGIDFGNATDLNLIPDNGVYGVRMAALPAADDVTFRAAYGNSTPATAAVTVYASAGAGVAVANSTEVLVTAAGMSAADSVIKTASAASRSWTLPTTTTKATLKFTVKNASGPVGGALITVTPSWSGTYGTTMVSPVGTAGVATYTTDALGNFSVTVTNSSPVKDASVSLALTGGAAFGTSTHTAVLTWATPVATTIAVADPISGLHSLTGSTNAVTVVVKDQFGSPVSGQTVTVATAQTPAVVSTTVIAPITTGAAGTATYSFTPAAASTSATVTFACAPAACSSSAVHAFTYKATLPVVATLTAYHGFDWGTAAVLTPATGIYSTGTTKLVIEDARDISSPELDPATTDSDNANDQIALRFTGLTAAGVSATGAPVTVTAGAGGHILSPVTGLPVKSHTYAVGATGTAVINVLATGTGAITFTATSGAVTATAAMWVADRKQTEVRDAANEMTAGRFITVTSAATGTANGTGVPVTVAVTDRYGNPVSGIALNVVASGVGSFMGGNITQSFTTDASGSYTFLANTSVSEGGVAKFTASTGTVGSFDSDAGYVGATEVDATLAAGNASASASITFAAGASAADIAQAAADAAAEAIDAGNNAYDAANAAGEAADAATAAAEQAGEDAVAAAQAAGEAAVAAAEAATEAAAEATDAANAATDAANASAEAADAATAAAQDAADAVAALSTQVSEMITALKKQITALTNLVIKIQKKVKA